VGRFQRGKGRAPDALPRDPGWRVSKRPFCPSVSRSSTRNPVLGGTGRDRERRRGRGRGRSGERLRGRRNEETRDQVRAWSPEEWGAFSAVGTRPRAIRGRRVCKRPFVRRSSARNPVLAATATWPIRRYADTPIRRYADTPIRRYADTPIRRYADTPIRRYG
jgi:hypothetical protein